MKRKYKRFLKAAYINYEEDYCSSGLGAFTKPVITTPIIVIIGTTATIACAISGATIYYTLDGSTPTTSSTQYTSAIALTQSCTIKAIAVKSGMTNSGVAEENYVKPITYLTQWTLVGNSEVHTDPFLTSWKVSGNSQTQQYLTQWKVSGNSEVHTLPYPDGVVLPNGYKRCEYLTFDGSSYIRPNIIPAYGIGVNFSFLTSTTGKSILGSRNSSYEASLLIGSVSDTAIAIGYGKSIFNIQVSDLANGEKHSIILDSSQLKIDGVDYAFSGRQSFVQNIPILLGALATGDSTFDSRCIVGNIYDTIFYNTQGELWHGIPCLDDNDVPCFYDLVSQTAFYNQGSGSFTYKLYPQPTEIWSCGDYSDVDGKYHVKISDGSNVYDIALTEPLRKVNDIADTIEFPSSVDGKALVTRAFGSVDLGRDMSWNFSSSSNRMYSGTNIGCKYVSTTLVANMLCSIYNVISNEDTLNGIVGIATQSAGAGAICVYDDNYNTSASKNDFVAHLQGVELVFELATPTAELVDVSPFPISPTDTYTSANVTPYSAFEYTKHSEIWSCGEYNPTDGKYHILVQPQGGSIADIALTEPLRKVNDVADTIEFPSEIEGKALVTRNLKTLSLKGKDWNTTNAPRYVLYIVGREYDFPENTREQGCIMCSTYTETTFANIYNIDKSIGIAWNGSYNLISLKDTDVVTPATDITGEVILKLTTPTTELVDVPQIEEAESYTCVISQGGKAVEWSEF